MCAQIFNNKLKKLNAEREERERERKKRKRHTESSDGADDKPEPEVQPPAALNVCNVVQEQMKEFKVRHTEGQGRLSAPHILKDNVT